MEYKSWYPQDFIQAAQQQLTPATVTGLLQEPQCGTRFVYGPLMLPTVLKYYLDLDQNTQIHRRMIPAKLLGYKLFQLSHTTIPVILPSTDPTSMVNGMLICALDNDQRNSIFRFEAGLLSLIDVQVQISQTDGPLDDLVIRNVRTIDTAAFAWPGSSTTEGLVPVWGSVWSMDEFLRGSEYGYIVESQRRQGLEAMSLGGGS
ncbi:hypothetical protein FE257_001521 [Aspergillus nanangensis]|uniref:Gamma-glutamylcyclotransferase AIG2-like domain-containing protein n=1 Tax=Aspergillus nanangensis TaxID=2582783 RepID=A0AAD4CV99_ASPNN|nr:hypothetical protein FE257_001521 [Aspergillus nanangensis]